MGFTVNFVFILNHMLLKYFLKQINFPIVFKYVFSYFNGVITYSSGRCYSGPGRSNNGPRTFKPLKNDMGLFVKIRY